MDKIELVGQGKETKVDNITILLTPDELREQLPREKIKEGDIVWVECKIKTLCHSLFPGGDNFIPEFLSSSPTLKLGDIIAHFPAEPQKAELEKINTIRASKACDFALVDKINFLIDAVKDLQERVK